MGKIYARFKQKSESSAFGFLFVPQAQHHLPVRATSFRAKRRTSLPLAAQMNEVEALPQMMLRQVANEVGLRPMKLRLCRK
ncbi:MAG: hypothetical protein J6J66_00810 [Clostridia bacterium]|nr:hypothetical protein [Clostridia bacterium]